MYIRLPATASFKVIDPPESWVVRTSASMLKSHMWHRASDCMVKRLCWYYWWLLLMGYVLMVIIDGYVLMVILMVILMVMLLMVIIDVLLLMKPLHWWLLLDELIPWWIILMWDGYYWWLCIDGGLLLMVYYWWSLMVKDTVIDGYRIYCPCLIPCSICIDHDNENSYHLCFVYSICPASQTAHFAEPKKPDTDTPQSHNIYVKWLINVSTVIKVITTLIFSTANHRGEPFGIFIPRRYWPWDGIIDEGFKT